MPESVLSAAETAEIGRSERCILALGAHSGPPNKLACGYPPAGVAIFSSLLGLSYDAIEWEFSGASTYRYCYGSSCDYSDYTGCDPTVTLWARLWEDNQIIAYESWTAEDIHNGVPSC